MSGGPLEARASRMSERRGANHPNGASHSLKGYLSDVNTTPGPLRFCILGFAELISPHTEAEQDTRQAAAASLVPQGLCEPLHSLQ